MDAMLETQVARFRSWFFSGLPFKVVGLQCCWDRGVCKTIKTWAKRCCCKWWKKPLNSPTVDFNPEVEHPKKWPCPVTYLYTYICSSLSLSRYMSIYIYVYMYIDLLIVPSKKEPCNDLFSRANQFFSNAGMLNVSPAVPIGFRVFREWDHSLTFWVPWVGWSCRKPGLLL